MPRRTIMLLVSAMIAGMLSMTGAQAAVTVENGVNASPDATPIAYSFAHPDGVTPSPVIAMTHGWGGSRTTDFSSGFVKTLLDNGFAVLTWDSRGFGTSGGEANTDSQEFEVKDLQSLIDMIGERSDVLLDGPLDPRMGMIGGSYAGGIQLMTAAADSRIDAIVPQIAWNDLPQSLKPGGVLKLGWDLLLYGAGAATATASGLPAQQTGGLSPQIHQSLVEGLALNDWSTNTYNWFDAKSPKHYINGANLGGQSLPGINIPTLVLQGASDTLFNLNQGIDNFEAIAARAPAKLVAFCGGHTITPLGTSCSKTGTGAKLDAVSLAWLNRYVKGDTGVDTGAAIEYQLQDGSFRSAAALPTTTVEVDGTTRITNTVAPTTGQGFAGTSGGCRPRTAADGSTGGVLPGKNYIQECPYSAGEWIEVARYGDYINTIACWIPGEGKPGEASKPLCPRENFHLPEGTQILGAGSLEVEATGAGPEGYAFFKLVDYDTVTKAKTVIDDQVTAQKFTWLSLTAPRRVTIDLAGVSWLVKKNHQIFVEINATSSDHASSRSPNVVNLNVTAKIPVINP